MKVQFRFQELEVWRRAIGIADQLFGVADELEHRRLYRFAEQLRGAGMSMSNNIAEGSGSASKKEFAQFVNIARRSTFENANILILLHRQTIITADTLHALLNELERLGRQFTALRRSLLAKRKI